MTKEEQNIVDKRIQDLIVLFSMVGLKFENEEVYYKIDKSLSLFNKKKEKFNLKDAAIILAESKQLFKEEE